MFALEVILRSDRIDLCAQKLSRVHRKHRQRVKLADSSDNCRVTSYREDARNKRSVPSTFCA